MISLRIETKTLPLPKHSPVLNLTLADVLHLQRPTGGVLEADHPEADLRRLDLHRRQVVILLLVQPLHHIFVDLPLRRLVGDAE